MTPETEKRLKEIEEREKAATEGPWIKGHNHQIVEDFLGLGICSMTPDPQDDKWAHDNADFIIESRADIPWLIAVVRMQEIALEDKWAKLGVPVIPKNCPTVKEES